jgi:hypothetical protein
MANPDQYARNGCASCIISLHKMHYSAEKRLFPAHECVFSVLWYAITLTHGFLCPSLRSSQRRQVHAHSTCIYLLGSTDMPAVLKTLWHARFAFECMQLRVTLVIKISM